jgi:hypothetical protein
LGTAIIDAIKSGLGLISEIAKEFLAGFTALFWDATANSNAGALTTFGTFCLIFLGISITFGLVKMAIYLIRSKTGC